MFYTEILPDENPIIRNINDLENGTLSIFCLITEDYAVKTGLNSSSLYWEFQNNDEVISKIPGYIIDERFVCVLQSIIFSVI